MTNMPYWPEAAAALKPFSDRAEIGLHFNLTEGAALVHQDLFCKNNQLIVRAFTRRLDKQKIKDELLAQIDSFEKQLGFLPRFIDGHQHIHHLPVIRDALLDVYQQVFPNKNAYIRISANPLLKTLKQTLRNPKILIIALTGAYALQRRLVKLNIPHNKTFSGIYNLLPDNDYEQLFKLFLSEIDENGLIMCHPGLQSTDQSDEIRGARWNEYRYFSA